VFVSEVEELVLIGSQLLVALRKKDQPDVSGFALQQFSSSSKPFSYNNRADSSIFSSL